jgi:O-antigen ligase
MNLFNKIFKRAFLFIFLAELFSLFGYLLPNFNKAAFLIIILLTLILSLYKLEYGIWIVLAELFIGSKGYLFFFEYGGLVVSIRIVLWLIVMSVWAGKVITNWLKTKKLDIPFLKSSYSPYFFILFLSIVWGLINGILNNNEFNNLFFDFNNWLYFALIFPAFSIISEKKNINGILQIFIASIIWLALKTFFLLFAFSHNLIGVVSELYRWVRITGVGEITQMQGGFYRIFFQSHIFVLIGFFIFLFLLSDKIINNSLFKNKNIFFLLSCCLVILLSVIIISFSRSFWVGFAFGLLLFYAYLIWQKIQWKKVLQISNFIIVCAIISFIIIVVTVKFPYPSPTGGFSTTGLLSKRASQLTGEAALSSRWELFPKIWQEIKRTPILGQGFGTTITYKSSDPRVLKTSPTGEYTTYAFEWGWLDIWLKLGLFGLLAYLVIIMKVYFRGLIQQNNNEESRINLGLIIGLAVVTVVSIFSPYLNHPLGIGYLIIVSAILNKDK